MSLIGTTVSHYEILEKLGGGGMGVVYRAEDTKLRRQVALKFLHVERVSDDEANKRFVLEAQTASSLNHPNICTIHEIGETDEGRMFIAMALYEGRTLRSLLQEAEGTIDWEVAVDIAAQIADGLAAAHERGIIHRDIKPANIQIAGKNRAVILDFGIAKLSGAMTLTQMGSTLGTTAYMSPEQVRAEEIDQRSDIWALGAVLYEMLTGRRPFEGDYDQAVIYNILNAPHASIGSLRPGLPDTLKAVVDKALEKDRNLRYASGDDLLADLNALRGVERTFVPKAGGSGRKKAVWVALLATALVLLAIGGYGLFSGDARPQGVELIAVLPLANLSGDLEEEYFADGMTDALITELSKIGALRVISRRSVMRYKGSDKPLTEIASEMGIDAIVEGSVIRVDDAVRVNAQLVLAGSDENVWAESFDRELQNVRVLHSDLVRSIAEELQVSLTAGERAGLSSTVAVDPRAYEAYLKGQFYRYQASPATYELALEQFNRALEIDPNFADAYSGIARVWTAAGLWGGVEADEAVRRSRDALRKALELNENLSEAYYTLALLAFIYEWNWDEAEAAFKRAIELSPNVADWHILYADYLSSMRRHEDAVAEARKGVELDPLSALSYAGLGWVLLCARDYEGSLEAHNEALRINPSSPFALRGRWWLNYHRGDIDAAMADAVRFYEIQDHHAAAELLRREFPRRQYEEAMSLAAKALEAHSDTVFIPSMRVARLYAHAGQYDRVLDLLEKSVEERFPSVPAMNVDPQWDELRSHPRFQSLIEKLGLPTRAKPT